MQPQRGQYVAAFSGQHPPRSNPCNAALGEYRLGRRSFERYSANVPAEVCLDLRFKQPLLAQEPRGENIKDHYLPVVNFSQLGSAGTRYDRCFDSGYLGTRHSNNVVGLRRRGQARRRERVTTGPPAHAFSTAQLRHRSRTPLPAASSAPLFRSGSPAPTTRSFGGRLQQS